MLLFDIAVGVVLTAARYGQQSLAILPVVGRARLLFICWSLLLRVAAFSIEASLDCLFHPVTPHGLTSFNRGNGIPLPWRTDAAHSGRVLPGAAWESERRRQQLHQDPLPWWG